MTFIGVAVLARQIRSERHPEWASPLLIGAPKSKGAHRDNVISPPII
jgi:hypothetical protein